MIVLRQTSVEVDLDNIGLLRVKVCKGELAFSVSEAVGSLGLTSMMRVTLVLSEPKPVPSSLST